RRYPSPAAILQRTASYGLAERRFTVIQVTNQQGGVDSYVLRSTLESQKRPNFEWTIYWPGQQIYDSTALDLLEIAKGIHMADRMFRRRLRLGERTRMIVVRIPVEQPGLWKRVSSDIEELARFASTDCWKLEFTALRRQKDKRRIQNEFVAS